MNPSGGGWIQRVGCADENAKVRGANMFDSDNRRFTIRGKGGERDICIFCSKSKR